MFSKLKLADHRCRCRSTGQTDGQTDGRTERNIDPAQPMRAASITGCSVFCFRFASSCSFLCRFVSRLQRTSFRNVRNTVWTYNI